MNVGYPYCNPLVKVLSDSSHGLSCVAPPTFQPHVAPHELSAGRYIRQLEEEVEEITRQYESACQLLYRVALVQDFSGIGLEEASARGEILEQESTAYSDALRVLFRRTVSLLQARRDSPVESEMGVARQKNHSMSIDLKGLSEQVVDAIRQPLHRENERIVELIDSLPQQVCVAVNTSSSAEGASLAAVMQQLEHVMTRINEVAEGLSHMRVDGVESPHDDCAKGVGAATALQMAVKGFEESSQRIAEALYHYNHRGVNESASPFPRPITSSRVTKVHEPPFQAEENADIKILQQLAYGTVATLSGLMIEYTFFSEQMRMTAEHETTKLRLANEGRQMTQLRCLIRDKESDFEHLREQVEELWKERRMPAKEYREQREVRTDAAEPTLAQLYAKCASPFIPPNVRMASAVKLQSIAKLRKEALRVGARPAEMVKTGAAISTSVGKVLSSDGPLRSSSERGAAVSENEEERLHQTTPVPIKNPPAADADAVRQSKDNTIMVRRLNTASPSLSTSFVSREQAPVTIRSCSTVALDHKVKEEDEGGDGGATAVVVRQLRRFMSSTSDVSTVSSSCSDGDGVEPGKTLIKSNCMLERNSFDKSSDSHSRIASHSVSAARADNTLRDLHTNEKVTAAVRRMKDRGIGSDSSSESITLTLESSRKGHGKASAARAGHKATDIKEKLSDLFDLDDSNTKTSSDRGEKRNSYRKGKKGDDASGKRREILPEFHTFSFSPRQ